VAQDSIPPFFHLPHFAADFDRITAIETYFCMRTTLLLDDEVHRQAKQASARLGIPLTRFIEEAIRLRISTEAALRAEPVRKLPVCRSKGGLQPGIDLDNAAELLNILDQATEPTQLR
jgi:hypothetical protein